MNRDFLMQLDFSGDRGVLVESGHAVLTSVEGVDMIPESASAVGATHCNPVTCHENVKMLQ